MREITDHRIQTINTPLNDKLRIVTTDEPGAGGAYHRYVLSLLDEQGNERVAGLLEFQKGPIKEAGLNGISNEALLAVVIDRLRCFEAGPFACFENSNALAHAEGALKWLHRRTEDRIARQVEGENKA